MKKGSTFLSLTPGSREKHLYCIITDPDKNGKVIIVNFTKRHLESDTSCIAKKGEHRFLNKYTESIVQYSEATVVLLSNIENAIQSSPDNFFKHDDLSTELLNRIISGAEISEFLNRSCWNFFNRKK
ncbi:hypothetical protein JWG44_14590 [Leptospira sp. 201903071]|uniref:hypothetical protein n=1 Tax=Leptospira ainazelensis TaxID=2810034 RepID=UPI001962E88A|nr:hypothetical protein [Leptospira ainazelensis]MBM9501480.1 hypothetical protein [Leptospira ainazelensis]